MLAEIDQMLLDLGEAIDEAYRKNRFVVPSHEICARSGIDSAREHVLAIEQEAYREESKAPRSTMEEKASTLLMETDRLDWMHSEIHEQVAMNDVEAAWLAAAQEGDFEAARAFYEGYQERACEIIDALAALMKARIKGE